jgi:hypothetical protein
VPLSATLNGGAAVLSRAMVLKLGPKVGRGESCRYRCA